MKIEQIYTNCLAHGAYYIQSGKEAAIIDPLREVEPYLQRAKEDGAYIKYIFETHFHADFVSGHVTLAEKTGAPIVFGPGASANYPIRVARDGEVFRLGEVSIQALHTPGHTPESVCYLLKDEQGKDYAVFSGDTLFLGDVGRPDLAQTITNQTQEQLAGTLYDSLRAKIMPLADHVIVYPAHGAGSACGKNLMAEKMDTLGNQKRINYALRANMTREEFIQEVTDGLPPPPGYFWANVKMNKEGYDSSETVLGRGLVALSPEAFETAVKDRKALVLDVRSPQEFAQAHLPGSLFIGLDGSFAPWVGELIQDINQPLALVAPEGREQEAITRLARVGFDGVLGYLQGGAAAWKTSGRRVEDVASISATDFLQQRVSAPCTVVDVRRANEYQADHLDDATNIPLSRLDERVNELPKEPFYIHCTGGYRSMIAASIAQAHGAFCPINVEGGFTAIRRAQPQVV